MNLISSEVIEDFDSLPPRVRSTVYYFFFKDSAKFLSIAESGTTDAEFCFLHLMIYDSGFWKVNAYVVDEIVCPKICMLKT